MKKAALVTLDDLETMAKSKGWCIYDKLSINWNGEHFNYWLDDRPTIRLIAEEYLKERRIWG